MTVTHVVPKFADEERILDVDNVGMRYPNGSLAIDSVTLDVRRGEFVSIVGPSGCGKTTLMKCLSGLVQPSSGFIDLHGSRVTAPPPEMVLVFQDYSRSLYPWLTVAKNVEMPLRANKRMKTSLSEQGRRDRVTDSLDAVGLLGTQEKYPWQLSGGMQQRVAIARAIAFRPEILLLDEPFASVDALSREDLEDLVLMLRQRVGMTVVMVTHDIDEAVYMSDRVYVLGPSPSVVVLEVPIDLGVLRDQLSTRSCKPFLKLRQQIHQQIRWREEPANPMRGGSASPHKIGILT